MRFFTPFVAACALLTGLSLTAQGGSDFTSLRESFERQCGQRDWSQVQCKTASPGDPDFLPYRENAPEYDRHVRLIRRRSGPSLALSRTRRAIGETWNSLGELVRGGANSSEMTGSDLFDYFSRRVEMISDRHHLQPCQEVCLSTCAATSLIRYRAEDFAVAPEDILERGAGNCRAFTHLALSFANHLGVRGLSLTGGANQTGGGHAWLRYAPVGEPARWIEPQNGNGPCSFTPAH